MFRTCSYLVSLIVILGAAVTAKAQDVDIGGIDIGGPVPGLPGGPYYGPGDTVPPGAGGPGGPCGTMCATPPAACGTTVCPADWTPVFIPGCWACRPCFEHLVTVEAYNMTIEDLLNLVCGPESAACTDANGNMSIQITSNSGACRARALISSWLVHGTYANMPINATVPVLACINGQVMCNASNDCDALGVDCQLTKTTRCLQCQPATVTLTFNRNCMCNALTAWRDYLISVDAWEQHKHVWILHVGFTTCDPCD